MTQTSEQPNFLLTSLYFTSREGDQITIECWLWHGTTWTWTKSTVSSQLTDKAEQSEIFQTICVAADNLPFSLSSCEGEGNN